MMTMMGGPEVMPERDLQLRCGCVIQGYFNPYLIEPVIRQCEFHKLMALATKLEDKLKAGSNGKVQDHAE